MDKASWIMVYWGFPASATCLDNTRSDTWPYHR